MFRKNSRFTDKRSWYYRKYGHYYHGWGLRFASCVLDDGRYRETHYIFGVLCWRHPHPYRYRNQRGD